MHLSIEAAGNKKVFFSEFWPRLDIAREAHGMPGMEPGSLDTLGDIIAIEIS